MDGWMDDDDNIDDDYNVKKWSVGVEREEEMCKETLEGGGRRGRPTPTGDRLRLEYIASG